VSLPAINSTKRDDSGLPRGHFARNLFLAALKSPFQFELWPATFVKGTASATATALSSFGYCLNQWRGRRIAEKVLRLRDLSASQKEKIMSRYLNWVLGLVFVAVVAFVASAAQDVASVAEGTVKHISATAKIIVVKTADGTEHTFHFVARTSIHGAEEIGKGAEDAFYGLKEGSHVAVHYTVKGTEETAEEVDHIGKGGLKATEGTVKVISRGAKKITVKTADGAEETFRLTDRAARDAGKGIGEGAEKSEHVTVYYSDEAGHKVAHFVKKVV